MLGAVLGTSSSFELNQDQKSSVPPLVTQRNMTKAILASGCSLDELSFLIAHASGTLKGDRSELSSINALLGKDMASLPVCALKAYTGHMGVASDLAEIIFGILAVKENVIPASLNFRATEEAFSGLNISGSPQTSDKKRFLSSSYGIGGQASSVVIDVRQG